MSSSHIEELLTTPVKQRKQQNHGYDPLSTLPDAYIEGEKELPSTEQRWEEGHQYVNQRKMQIHSDDVDSDTLDFYVIEEMYTVEENSAEYGLIEECREKWEEISHEIHG